MHGCMQGEREAGNPVASIITALHLERNRITLALANHLDVEEDSDDDDAAPGQAVQVLPAVHVTALLALQVCTDMASTTSGTSA